MCSFFVNVMSANSERTVSTFVKVAEKLNTGVPESPKNFSSK